MGNPTVDYLSLDVEGSELDILHTIPWNKVDIRTLTVEVVHSSESLITDFMKRQGYSVVKRLANIDVMFSKDN